MTHMSDIIRAAKCYNDTGALEQLLDTIKDYYKPPPPLECFVCGATEEDTETEWNQFQWPGLMEIEITVAAGEEGYSHVKKYVCARDQVRITDALVELGFGDHRHGSTTAMEAPDNICGGYGKCELGTPEE
jgi:hypothetical protein